LNIIHELGGVRVRSSSVAELVNSKEKVEVYRISEPHLLWR